MKEMQISGSMESVTGCETRIATSHDLSKGRCALNHPDARVRSSAWMDARFRNCAGLHSYAPLHKHGLHDSTH
eukprot:2692363-Pleurochrysis_carterae.AAC.1